MIRLVGFAASNYYNKVKLVMLEKGIAFQEVLQWPGQEAVDGGSPLGKIPYVVTPQGPICESEVICEWLEQSTPEPRLLPADPYAAAKVRELVTFIELHLELVARRVYPQAFFGGKVSDTTISSTRAELEHNVRAFARLAKFVPYVAGDSFTLADCAAIVHLPLVSMAGRAVWGSDPLKLLPVRPYLAQVAERPAVARITADRKAGQAAASDHLAALRSSAPR